MKFIRKTILIIILFNYQNIQSQIGVGTTSPSSSSIIHLESTTKGFLPPRLTTSQRDNINGSVFAEGLIVYNTDIKCLEFYNGTTWINFCGAQSGPNLPNPPANIESIPLGVATLNSKVCFDISETEDLTNNTGSLLLRTYQRSDFEETSVNTQTLRFKSTTAVSHLTFYAEDTTGQVIASFTPDADYSTNSSFTEASAVIVYKSTLSSPDPNSPTSAKALGLSTSEALRAKFYVVYNDMTSGNGTDRRLEFTPMIKDSECGGFTNRAANFNYHLTDNGEVHAYGENFAGELGRGFITNGYEGTIGKVVINENIIGVSQGHSISSFLTDGGNLYINHKSATFLDNASAGTGIPVKVPTPGGLPVVDMVSSSGMVLYKTSDGKIYAIGGYVNHDGQIGGGPLHADLNSPSEVQVPAGVNVIDFDVIDRYTILLDDNNKIYTAGLNTLVGRTGGSSFQEVNLPVGHGNIIDISASQSGGTIVIDDLGHIYVWGLNNSGQLGVSGSVALPTELVKPATMTANPIKIWTGSYNSFILTSDLKLWSTGKNGADGQAGKGFISGANGNNFTTSFSECPLPANVVPLYMHGLSSYTLLLGNDGNVYTAGREAFISDPTLVRDAQRVGTNPAKPLHTYHLIETPALLNSGLNLIGR